ncbi:transglycosylase SLT domain-containing protein [Streptomyces sp. NPDC005438]|uniref:transglycosylase SLT domain-containing protein n=1 Tax=Streptomyces sp. NPDC005438 TaxID=3156880 RepID=UPI0033A5E1F5
MPALKNFTALKNRGHDKLKNGQEKLRNLRDEKLRNLDYDRFKSLGYDQFKSLGQTRLAKGQFARLSKGQKYSAGVAAAGATAIVLALAPASNGDDVKTPQSAGSAVSFSVKAANVEGQKASVSEQSVTAAKKAEGLKRKVEAAKKIEAERKAAKEREAKKAASRSAQRKPAAKPSYPNNLDGWIREARDIMKKHGIPGSYNGIHRNIIRESGGDPRAINNWDINARNGVPSKGLLQVIKPTFDRYHVQGTKYDLYDPVANIVAACNYAAARYGSMDNVNSAY